METYVCVGCGAKIEAESPVVVDHPSSECDSGARAKFVREDAKEVYDSLSE